MMLKMGLAILLLALIASCGVFKTARGKYAQRHVPPAEGELKGYGKHLASKFGLMSLFAETAYRRTYDINEDSTNSTCVTAQPSYNDSLLPWSILDGKKYSWNRLQISEPTDIEPCFSGGGLFYETYVLEDDKGILLEAVIAYRGTDGLVDDMKTNLAAAVGFEPPQYAIAKSKLIPLVEYLRTISKEIKIYATGHSLGGGLAQQAGYLSKEIDEVFAFNSTPVTNWSSLALAKADEYGIENHYPVIYRVNHGGEGLDPIRYISTNFTSARFNRYDIDIQITKRKAVSGHGIRLITCILAREILDFSEEEHAEHFYGKEFIETHVLKISGEPNDTVSGICKGYFALQAQDQSRTSQ